jgi:predicted ester cyclase
MPVEENRALLRRFIAELNKGEAAALAAVDEICSGDFVQHNAYGEEVRGLENYKKRVADLCRACPDLHFVVDDVVVEGDKVASRWTMTGTQMGDLHHAVDLPATGRKVTAQWIAIDRIEDGKFVESWEKFDTLGMMRQLGFELTPAKASTKG